MYDRENYERYRHLYSAYMRRWWIKRKLDAIAYKGGQCRKCGYSSNYAAMVFHHRDPSQKECDWSRLKSQKWDVITAELDKCDLLCCRCHAEEHNDPAIAEEAIDWLKVHKRSTPQRENGRCPHCGVEFTRGRNRRFSVYCSRKCVQQSKQRAEYPADHELVSLVDATGKMAVSRTYGVSEATIRKRYKAARARLEHIS